LNFHNPVAFEGLIFTENWGEIRGQVWMAPRLSPASLIKQMEMQMNFNSPILALMMLLSCGLYGCDVESKKVTQSADVGSEATSSTSVASADAMNAGAKKTTIVDANLASGVITPYDFPVADATRKALIADKIGNPAYPNYRIGQLYGNNLAQVYQDFGINPNDIMTCDARHQQAIDINQSSAMTKQARNYFCRGEFNTPQCLASQHKRVYRGYCLDTDDSMDWLALQAVALNAAGRSVHIQPDRTFYINQALVIPSNTRMVWLASGETRFNGRSWERVGASFIKLQQEGRQLEPIDNFRKLGFSLGTVVTIADMPFLYSGKTPNQKEGIAESVALYYPHIDAGNLKGENALSMAQSVQNVDVFGGVLQNVKINAIDDSIAGAGGKALQCEAGCREVRVSGINIFDSHIGINSNAIVKYEHFKRWIGRTSDIIVDGVVMDNVDIPINVYNDFVDKTGSQRVHISNFYIHNSGRMTDAVYYERFPNLPRASEIFSSRISGNASQYFKNEPWKSGEPHDSGLVTSRGGYWVIVQNGKYFNDDAYGGVEGIVSGWGFSSKIDGVEYKLRFNCLYHPEQPGC
jgi:hypothetical protein